MSLLDQLAMPPQIAKAYEAGGASCLSVLTDSKFFQGGFENLQLIRDAGVTCPLLCKEFIVEVRRGRGCGRAAMCNSVRRTSEL